MSEPEPRCFVDSNIWLYAFIQSQDGEKSKIARELLGDDEEKLIVSTQVVNEVCVNLLRKAKLEESAVQQVVHAFYSRYDVVVLEESVLLMASSLRQRYSLSYWDSLIVAAALISDSTILFSEDMQDGLVINGRLTITNPFFTSS